MRRLQFMIAMLLALACTTGHNSGHDAAVDMTAVVKRLDVAGLVPLAWRNIESIIPRAGGSLSRLPYELHSYKVEDLFWESDDHKCGVYFGVTRPDAPASYGETRIYCTRPTRREAANLLLLWLGEIDAAYARRLRTGLPYLSGEIEDEFVVSRDRRSVRVVFDVRRFQSAEGWTARVEFHENGDAGGGAGAVGSSSGIGGSSSTGRSSGGSFAAMSRARRRWAAATFAQISL